MTEILSAEKTAEVTATLCQLLGLTPEQAQKIIKAKNRNKVKIKKFKEKTLPEYVQVRKIYCTLCKTEEIKYFFMKNSKLKNGVLFSTEVNKEHPDIKGLRVKVIPYKIFSCEHCTKKLRKLSSKDLTIILLNEVNRRDYAPI